jgi:hypothetical protein
VYFIKNDFIYDIYLLIINMNPWGHPSPFQHFTYNSAREGDLSQVTIDFAKQQGVTGPNFEKAIFTKNSNAPEDVVLHRGLETFLKNEYNFNSPTYKGNSGELHKYDGKKNWK